MMVWQQPEPTFLGITSEASFLQYNTVTFTPSNATEYSMTSTCAATESLPYATDAHTRITLGDEASTLIAFGASGFTFFGASSATARLCSNGYIYFSGACEYQFSTASHFASKRIRYADILLDMCACWAVLSVRWSYGRLLSWAMVRQRRWTTPRCCTLCCCTQG